MNSDLDKVLNVAPAPEEAPLVHGELVPVVEQVPATVDDEKEVNEDFQLARENLKEIIEEGKEILQEMKQVAKQSQHPRAYEVLGNLMKIAVDTNKDLLTLRKQKRELVRKTDGSPTTVNNNLVLSTADLLKLIKNNTNE
jgi:phage tail tape-measure protein